MPACVAHYQFGQDILSRLEEDLRLIVLAYKREFDIGLQGPDIFFFYKPYRHTRIPDYGTERHSLPGLRMFAPILEKVREKAALSYLTGLICHFVLDKQCHPYVYKHSCDIYEHMRMEAAFDRHILLISGLSKARYLYLPATGLDYESIASLWPGMTADTIKKCAKGERRATRLLDHKNFLETCETIAGRRGKFTPMTLPDSVAGIQTEHAANLYALYKKALDDCPELIRFALGLMGTKLMTGHGFDLNYNGNAADK